MRFGIGNGSDMIQRSLKTVTQSFSSLKIQAGAQRRSAAGAKVPLRPALPLPLLLLLLPDRVHTPRNTLAISL